MTRTTRVAVIGGGISGLTALHELRKNGLDAILYEASDRVGGRILTYPDQSGTNVELGSTYFHKYYYGVNKLLSEIGLSDRIEPKPRGKQAYVKDGRVVTVYPQADLIKSWLSRRIGWRDIESLLKIKRYGKDHCDKGCDALERFYTNDLGFVETLREDSYFNEGYDTRFTDSALVQQLTPSIRDYLLSPITRKQVFQDPEEMTTTLGAALLGVAGIELQTLKGGMEEIPRKLRDLHRMRVKLGTPVISIHEEEKVVISMERDQEFDYVVIALPFPQANALYEIDGKLEYSKGNVLLVRGDIRNPYREIDTLYIRDEDHRINSITRYNDIFKIETTREDPDLDEFFVNPDLIAKQEWKQALPKHPVGTRYPSMKQSERIYLVGDHWFPCMEVAVDTAIKAAKEIVRSAA
ncbi:MAG: FAD-dependent oxidoreductase [Candidatus Aenigmarchaeota archaeon]|nr:FAD-dependent oxidoreductase [Candidatus Aenigmarchaeota archaeon]